MYPVPDLLLRIWFGSLVSDLSFLSSISMMVSSGLAGAHVQPCPRNDFLDFAGLICTRWCPIQKGFAI
jgi:hypothetical protein